RERIGDYQILPIGETLVRWLSEQKEHLLARGVLVRVAEADTYERLSAKDEFLMICGENGIPTPPILENLNLDRFTDPFVVKPKGLMGGRGVLTFPLLVEDASSFRAFKSMQLDLRKHLIQAYVRGPSIYYCAMY